MEERVAPHATGGATSSGAARAAKASGLGSKGKTGAAMVSFGDERLEELKTT